MFRESKQTRGIVPTIFKEISREAAPPPKGPPALQHYSFVCGGRKTLRSSLPGVSCFVLLNGPSDVDNFLKNSFL